ncbi:MAG: hypothetical protein RIQ79_1721, partial [Verrucomicrobiota bacterium]
MLQLAAKPLVRDLRELLDPLVALCGLSANVRTEFVVEFTHEGVAYRMPRIVFTGPAAAHEPEPIRLGVFGGLHGDEPASVLAPIAFLERLAADPVRATGYELVVYPLCNPVGYALNHRHNGDGLDLNRQFWRGSAQPEVRALERELTVNRFDGLITLHADDTAEGIYG